MRLRPYIIMLSLLLSVSGTALAQDVQPRLVFADGDGSITLCPGQECSIEVQLLDYQGSDEDAPPVFLYDFGDGTIRQSSRNIQSHKYLEGGAYQMEVSLVGEDDTPVSAARRVLVPGPPKYDAFSSSTPKDNSGICLGDRVELAMPVENRSYECPGGSWDFSVEYDLRRAVWTGSGIGATSQGRAVATPDEEGVTRYTFMIGDNYGCYHDTSVYVEVERARIQMPEQQVQYIGDEIDFEDVTSWAVSSHWIMGDNSAPVSTNPAPHAYYEKGRYMVIMQSMSESGCVDVDTQYVDIMPRPLEVKEVNIFTPNGDGQNDVFTFFLEEESFLDNGALTKMPANIRSIRGKIYNVYGQTVYKWDEVEASIFGWDGTWHNKGSRDCPPGTYFYDIIVYGKDGNSLKRTGSILLVREK